MHQHTNVVARLISSVSFFMSSKISRTDGDSSCATRAAMRRRCGGVIFAGSSSVLPVMPVDSTVDLAYPFRVSKSSALVAGSYAGATSVTFSAAFLHSSMYLNPEN